MMAQPSIDRDSRENPTPTLRRLFVLGATGGTGSALVNQAIARGHDVTAFVRSPDRMPRRERLATHQGDPHDATKMATLMRGSDVVISTLGRRDKRDPLLLTDCMNATVTAMKAADVSRLIVVSSALLFPDVGLFGAFLGRFVFSLAVADSARMEAHVEHSDLEWTIVRPPRLLDRAPTGRFRARDGHLPEHGSSIARADLATFLIEEAERGAHVRRIVGVAS
jgi:putative NADH-flavin reductase